MPDTMNRLPPTAAVALAALGCSAPAATSGPADPYAADREAMVREHIEARGVTDPRVLRAMRTVPRHRFVAPGSEGEAYVDSPLGIGERQTISQPYVVAWMSELLRVGPGARVLEIGTGSGYQAAVLAEMGVEVFSIEIVEPLARRARSVLETLGYAAERGGRVHLRVGDGYRGWPEEAPFDAVLLTAAPPEIPEPLLEQLAVGGRLVAPVGAAFETQELLVVTRTERGFCRTNEGLVRFVPMTGEAMHGAH
jgi:protein-L-isoaspartate(D-aspartate) O-methyltransferase